MTEPTPQPPLDAVIDTLRDKAKQAGDYKVKPQGREDLYEHIGRTGLMISRSTIRGVTDISGSLETADGLYQTHLQTNPNGSYARATVNHYSDEPEDDITMELTDPVEVEALTRYIAEEIDKQL